MDNSVRENFLMDNEWKFHIGDIESSKKMLHEDAYGSAKAGGTKGVAAYNFDDNNDSWKTVNLPHDWAIETDFDENEALSQGYKKRGIGWYRKSFYLSKDLEEKQLLLVFGAIATKCTVYFNGSVLKRSFSGYMEFVGDITDRAYYGDRPNVIAIMVDASCSEGWWYEGAGIYRHVWLYAKNLIHIAHNGIWVNPVKKFNDTWEIQIETTIENTSYAIDNFHLSSEVTYNDNFINSSITNEQICLANGKTYIYQTIKIQSPYLWDLDNPNLYSLHTKLMRNGVTIDSEQTNFGCRTIAVTANEGFFLNGKRVKIKGTCNHQDHAGVGVAVPDSIQDYRIKRLKEMGSNAYRCSHNLPAKEILDACDKYGILVMDENRNFESNDEVLKQIKIMVERDRNHPCVVMYSLFNEEPLQGTLEGRKIYLRMMSTLKKLDDTRIVLGAMNGGIFEKDGAATVMDITGINYAIGSFDDFHKLYPNQPILGSENNSAFSTRGCYISDHKNHKTDCYDVERADWGQTIRETWESVDKRDFVAGIFIWTGFDYRGEPTPFTWPSIGTQFGVMDTCGIAKDSFYFNKACWTDKPMLHILPHWNWENGNNIKVMTVTNCEEVELFLNGNSLGRKSSTVFTQCEWLVQYDPGTLSAKAYNNNGIVIETEIKTAKKPHEIKIVADRDYIYNDGMDAIPVNICVVDEDGIFVPNASNMMKFDIDGDGIILGVGNGDPNSHEADYLPQRSLYEGWCQCLVQSNENAEQLTMIVSSFGLKSNSITFNIKTPQNKIKKIYAGKNDSIDGWSISANKFVDEPNPNMLIADNDMNSFEPITFQHNNLQNNFTDGYMLYRAKFSVNNKGKKYISFKKVVGDEVSIFANGICIFKSLTICKNVTVEIPDTMYGKVELRVLIKSSSTEKISGISGTVNLIQ